MSDQPLIPFEAEESVVSDALSVPAVIPTYTSILRPSMFGSVICRTVWPIIVKAYDEGRPVDLVGLIESLEQTGNLTPLGGYGQVASKLVKFVGSQYREFYAHLIRRAAIRRDILSLGQSILQLGSDVSKDVDEVLATVGRQWEAVSTSSLIRRDPVMLGEMLDRQAQAIEAVMDGTVSVDYIRPGLLCLRPYLSHYEPGQMYVASARPKRGKSSWAIGEAIAVARQLPVDQRVMFYSIELTERQVAAVIMSQESGVPYESIWQRNLSDQEYRDYLRTLAESQGIRIEFDFTMSCIDDILSHAATLTGVGAVVIDGAHRATSADPNHKTEYQVMTHVSRSTSRKAKAHKVPYIVVTQLNRQGATGRPTAEDLRGSGAWEEDCALAFALYWDDIHDADVLSGRLVETEFVILVNRDGPPGGPVALWDGTHRRYLDLHRPNRSNGHKEARTREAKTFEG